MVFLSTFSKVCGDLIGQICDADPLLDKYDRYDVLVSFDPSEASMMNMEHSKQGFDHGTFQAFDYGSVKENTTHYGQTTPPTCDLRNIRMPMKIFAETTDELVDP
jgi:hypothetical protein